MFKPEFNLNHVSQDERMYLLLKEIVSKFDQFPVLEQEWFSNELVEDAVTAVKEFEADFGPMHDGMVSKNFGHQFIEGAQLFTTNGRRCGNGWLIQKKPMPVQEHEQPEFMYIVLTDAGSTMKLTKRELERAFEAGDWICDPERIIRDFDRNGYFSQPEEPVDNG